jgi:hypothetical protein
MRLHSLGSVAGSTTGCSSPGRSARRPSIPSTRNTASWCYVFGSAALVVFALQFVTGILLALVYVPSGAEAWSSLQALNHEVALGWFIRALHWMGIELHGRDRARPHDASLPLRRL